MSSDESVGISFGEEISELVSSDEKELTEKILNIGATIAEKIDESECDVAIFLGRSAAPGAWVLEEMQNHTDALDDVSVAILNTGKGGYRGKYLPNKGDALVLSKEREVVGRMFVGEADTSENQEEFKQAIRDDKDTIEKVRRVLLSQTEEDKLRGKILIFDDIGFEGVQKMFVTVVLQECFSPENIDYAELPYLRDLRGGLGLSTEFEHVVDDSKLVEDTRRRIKRVVSSIKPQK